jgi:hypothetical protein
MASEECFLPDIVQLGPAEYAIDQRSNTLG